MAYMRSPITDLFGKMSTLQSEAQNELCRALEMQMLKCIEVRGHPNYLRDCRDEVDDVHECTYMRKQKERWIVIQNERTRQYEEGKLKERFMPPPPKHAYGSPLAGL